MDVQHMSVEIDTASSSYSTSLLNHDGKLDR